MDWQHTTGAQPGAPSQLERDTGLDEHQQRQRAAVARLWAWRITWLLMETGCSAVDALRAVEDADRSAS